MRFFNCRRRSSLHHRMECSFYFESSFYPAGKTKIINYRPNDLYIRTRTRVLQANLFNLTEIKYILSEFDGVNKPNGKYMCAISLKCINISTTMLSSYLYTNAKVCVDRSFARALPIVLQLLLENCGWRKVACRSLHRNMISHRWNLHMKIQNSVCIWRWQRWWWRRHALCLVPKK